jgi:hypothetical protein
MPPRPSPSTRCCLGLAVILGVVLIGASAPSLTAEEAGGYAPVGPPAAINAVLRIQLKTVCDWIAEKDFPSAVESARGLTTLAHLYAYHSADADWRKRCAALQDATTRLTAAAQRKSMADCDKQAAEVTQLLEELQKSSAGADKKTLKDFRPQGSVKTWMVLVDTAHVEAKSAKSAKEFLALTQAVAAEANAMAFLNKQQNWQKEALAVRDLALQAADQVKGDDLTAARAALKTMRQRCEVCHDRRK